MEGSGEEDLSALLEKKEAQVEHLQALLSIALAQPNIPDEDEDKLHILEKQLAEIEARMRSVSEELSFTKNVLQDHKEKGIEKDQRIEFLQQEVERYSIYAKEAIQKAEAQEMQKTIRDAAQQASLARESAQVTNYLVEAATARSQVESENERLKSEIVEVETWAKSVREAMVGYVFRQRQAERIRRAFLLWRWKRRVRAYDAASARAIQRGKAARQLHAWRTSALETKLEAQEKEWTEKLKAVEKRLLIESTVRQKLSDGLHSCYDTLALLQKEKNAAVDAIARATELAAQGMAAVEIGFARLEQEAAASEIVRGQLQAAKFDLHISQEEVAMTRETMGREIEKLRGELASVKQDFAIEDARRRAEFEEALAAMTAQKRSAQEEVEAIRDAVSSAAVEFLQRLETSSLPTASRKANGEQDGGEEEEEFRLEQVLSSCQNGSDGVMAIVALVTRMGQMGAACVTDQIDLQSRMEMASQRISTLESNLREYQDAFIQREEADRDKAEVAAVEKELWKAERVAWEKQLEEWHSEREAREEEKIEWERLQGDWDRQRQDFERERLAWEEQKEELLKKLSTEELALAEMENNSKKEVVPVKEVEELKAALADAETRAGEAAKLKEQIVQIKDAVTKQMLEVHARMEEAKQCDIELQRKREAAIARLKVELQNVENESEEKDLQIATLKHHVRTLEKKLLAGVGGGGGMEDGGEDEQQDFHVVNNNNNRNSGDRKKNHSAENILSHNNTTNNSNSFINNNNNNENEEEEGDSRFSNNGNYHNGNHNNNSNNNGNNNFHGEEEIAVVHAAEDDSDSDLEIK